MGKENWYILMCWTKEDLTPKDSPIDTSILLKGKKHTWEICIKCSWSLEFWVWTCSTHLVRGVMILGDMRGLFSGEMYTLLLPGTRRGELGSLYGLRGICGIGERGGGCKNKNNERPWTFIWHRCILLRCKLLIVAPRGAGVSPWSTRTARCWFSASAWTLGCRRRWWSHSVPQWSTHA